MARFTTTIASRLDADAALAYMAAFEHSKDWDPSVEEAHRVGAGPLAVGTRFDLKARFGGRLLPLVYEITRLDAAQVELVAQQKVFTGTDVVTVSADGAGSRVVYDARIDLHGAARLLDPIIGLLFKRACAKAVLGLQRELNR